MKRLTTALPLGLAALLLLAGHARAQQDEPALRSVPAGAAAYISVDLPAIQQFWNQVKAAPALQGLLDGTGQDGKPQQGPTMAVQLLGVLTQTFPERIGIAWAGDAPVPGQIPNLLLVAPIKDQQGVQGLLTMLQGLLKAENAQVTTRDYQGVAINTITSEKMKGQQPSYSLLPDRLLVATQPAMLEKALDASAGRGATLADDPAFSRIRQRVTGAGGGALWFWADVARLNQNALQAMEQATKGQTAGGEAKVSMLPFRTEALAPMLQMYQGAAGRVVLSQGGVAADGFVLVNPASEYGRRLLEQKGAPLRSARLTSGNALLYYGFNNLPYIVQTVRAVLAALGPDVQKSLDGVAQMVEASTGLNLKTDVLDHLGSEVALAINDVPADLKATPALLYIQTTNKAALGKAMQKLRAQASQMGVRFVQKDLPQGRLYHMAPEGAPIPVPAGWTFASDFLVLGSSPEAMKSPLYLASGTGTSLSATPGYQRAVGAGGDRLFSALYVNLAKLPAILQRLPVPKPAGNPAPQWQGLLKALRSLAVTTALEPDGMSFRAELAANLGG